MAEPYELTEPTPTIKVDSLEDGGWTVPAGWYGFAAASGPGLIHAAKVDDAAGVEALRRLGEPEAESRSQQFEGRRVVRIDGGYIVLNFMRYRDFDHSASDRMRRLRARRNQKIVTANDRNVTANVTPVRANVTHSREQIAESRKNTLRAAPAPRAPDPLFDALCLFEGIPLREVGSAGGRIGKALAEIRGLSPEVTPAEIERRGRNYRRHFTGAASTAAALAKHWGKCHAEPQQLNENHRRPNDRSTGHTAGYSDQLRAAGL